MPAPSETAPPSPVGRKRKPLTTDTQCRNAKPEAKPYKWPVGKGLYLEVKPNGVKAWRYRFELREGDAMLEVCSRQALFA